MEQRYIFISKGNSTAAPSGYTINEASQLNYVGYVLDGVKLPGVVKLETLQARPDLFLIATDMQLQKIKENQNSTTTNTNTTKMDKSTMFNSILPAENVGGQNELVRMETPENGNASIITVNIALNYSTPDVGAPTASLLIGDGFDIIKTANPTFDNVEAAVAAGLVIGGTFGTSTLTILKNMSIKGVRFHIFQGEANAASYWSNKVAARQLETNPQGSTNFVDMDFQLYQDGSQFNDKIRQIPNFRFSISEWTALQIIVLPGETVNLTMKYQSVGKGNAMQLVR